MIFSHATVTIRCMESPGQRYERLKKERGLTDQAVAESARVAIGSVYNFKRGDREPTMSTTRSIAKALGVTPQYLLFGRELLSDLSNAELRTVLAAFAKEDLSALTRVESLVKEIRESGDTPSNSKTADAMADPKSDKTSDQ